MTPPVGTRLRLEPDRCDRCGACVSACAEGALRVGASYIYVDWRRCDGCLACVEACGRGAIQPRNGPAPQRPAPAARPAASARSASVRSARSPRDEATSRPASGQGGSRAPSSWTPAEAAALLAVTLAAFIVKDALLAQRWVLALRPSLHVLVRVLALGAYYAVQLGTLVAIARVRGRDVLESVRLRVPSGRWRERGVSIAHTAALTALTLCFALLYAIVLQELGKLPQTAGMADIFGPDVVGFMLSVAMIALVAPFAEEVVFRGVLFDALATRWGSWPGILGAALVFSAFHVSWWTLLPTFALGTAAGWLAARRRSLWPAVALHAAYNLTLVAVTYLGGL